MIAVARVETDHGSHIEPPLEEWWSDLKKLQWHAALAMLDGGLPAGTLQVREGNAQHLVTRGRWWWKREEWVPYADVYQLNYSSPKGSGSIGDFGYREMWVLLTGVKVGADLAVPA